MFGLLVLDFISLFNPRYQAMPLPFYADESVDCCLLYPMP